MVCMCVLVNSHFAENPSTCSWITTCHFTMGVLHWVIFVEPDGRLNEVLYEYARWGLFMTRPESGEGLGRLIVIRRI
jgi:hypothetical protein